MTDKQVVSGMFQAFREKGFQAEENFLCCQSCGWAAMGEIAKDNDNNVFYHEQDNESFGIFDGNINGTLFLSWCGDGNVLKEIIEQFGYEVEWDGTENKRIGIKGRVNQ